MGLFRRRPVSFIDFIQKMLLIGFVVWLGGGLLIIGLEIYRQINDQRTEAQIVAVRTMCEMEWRVSRRRSREIDVPCAEVPLVRAANPSIDYEVKEFEQAAIRFVARDGSPQLVAVRASKVDAEGAHVGDLIPITYSPSNPGNVRGLLTVSKLLEMVQLTLLGVICLGGWLLVRRLRAGPASRGSSERTAGPAEPKAKHEIMERVLRERAMAKGRRPEPVVRR